MSLSLFTGISELIFLPNKSQLSMKWTHQETADAIDKKSGKLILSTDVRNKIDSHMQVPYYEITFEHPDGTRRAYYESCDEAPIHELMEKKRKELEDAGCEIIGSEVRWA